MSPRKKRTGIGAHQLREAIRFIDADQKHRLNQLAYEIDLSVGKRYTMKPLHKKR